MQSMFNFKIMMTKKNISVWICVHAVAAWGVLLEE